MPQPYIIAPATGSDPQDEWVRLGVEAQSQNKFPDAERHYRQALRLDPQHALATQNLGVLYAQLNNLNEALLTVERASMFDGDHALIYMNRALMCLEAERIEEALEVARKGVEKVPGVETRMALAMILAVAGLAEEAIPLYNAVLDQVPNHPTAGPNSCFIQTLTEATPADLLVQRKRYHAANKHPGTGKPHHVPGDKPIRVGYVGGDFKSHSAAMIFGNVVLNHDKSRVTPYLYSTLPVDPKADGSTAKFQEAAGSNWREIHGLSDEDADNLIRRDRIDILVDLAGHTNGGRLPLFTRKPAPIQVTAWGFAHGTGCPEIDYFLACPVSIPEEDRKHYAEKVVDLPSIVTYLPPDGYNLKGKSALPYHANDYITFGSYARYEKLSDKCLQTFAEILRRVPDAKLQLKDHGFRRPYSIKRVLRLMEGIDPKRIRFSISTSHPDHMLAYQQADLILDPFPHSGGVVALETLYMGVPLITLYGPQPSGRQASSVLTQMGRTDWIARSHAEYIDKAVALAGDIGTLQKARKTLRDEFLKSPVVTGYREAVETLYERMVADYQRK